MLKFALMYCTWL